MLLSGYCVAIGEKIEGDSAAGIIKQADPNKGQNIVRNLNAYSSHFDKYTKSSLQAPIPRNTMAKQVKAKQPKTKPHKQPATKVNNQEVKQMLLPDKKTIAKQKKNIKLMHKQKFRLVLKQDLMNCPICLETMLNPATTVCGHSFCLPCIEQHFFRASIDQDAPSCPSCRNPLNYYDCHQSNQLKAMIDYYHSNFGKEDDIAGYQKRRQEFQQQEQRRNLKEQELEQGIKVDYFNIHHCKWQSGEIFQKNINEEETILLLKIKADPGCILSHRHHQIKAKSRLLARHAYFTQRYQQSSDSWEEETIDHRHDAAEVDQSNDSYDDNSDDRNNDDDEQDSDSQSQSILMRSAPNRIQEDFIGNNESRQSAYSRDQFISLFDSDQQDSSPNSDILSVDY